MVRRRLVGRLSESLLFVPVERLRQFRYLASQCCREAHCHRQCRQARAGLEAAEVGDEDAGAFLHLFLRKASGEAELTEVSPEKLRGRGTFRRQSGHLHLTNHESRLNIYLKPIGGAQHG